MPRRLELLFSIDRSAHVVGVLAIHQPPDAILAREPGNEAVLVLVDTSGEVGCHADLKGA